MDIGSRAMPIYSRVLAVLAAVAFLAGCSFEHPLTKYPSSDLNTWLLGVWEHTGEKGEKYRAQVTPQTSDRYWIVVEKAGKTRAQTKTYRFSAHISRVGNSKFLTLECLEGAGDLPDGRFVFAHHQVLDQNHLRIRIPQLDSPPEASGYQLRKEIRRKLRDNSLYPDPGTVWNRTSEVYWAESDGLQPKQALRFPIEDERKANLKLLREIQEREEDEQRRGR